MPRRQIVIAVRQSVTEPTIIVYCRTFLDNLSRQKRILGLLTLCLLLIKHSLVGITES